MDSSSPLPESQLGFDASGDSDSDATSPTPANTSPTIPEGAVEAGEICLYHRTPDGIRVYRVRPNHDVRNDA